MERRTFLGAAGAAAVAQESPARRGRLKQGVSRWCYKQWTLDDLCANAKRLGVEGVDLVDPPDWPTIRKYGLTPSMVPGGGTIPDGLNRKENHAKILGELRANIERAAVAGLPNVITFSGNRRGLSDDEGLANCAAALDQVKAFAEEKGVTICMELLNSKVNHKDYQADRTEWGAELCRQVNSPRVKLLYDVYHMQIMEGDVIRTIRENIAWIGHFHTGGNPGRGEIDGTQELNYRAIAQAVADLGFKGFFSHEFAPKRDLFEGLKQAVEICTV
jgi:hydroxypyruvate isomerase